MSSYEYYEFQAVDRPLTDAQMRALRGASSRALITRTRFVNEYSYGQFRGDPRRWMDQYFDAHLYVSKSGTRVAELRVPRRALNARMARRVTSGGCAVRASGQHTVLSWVLEDDDAPDWLEAEELSGWMALLLSCRRSLITGDQRVLYLTWLFAVQHEAVDDDAVEPVVPPGLGALDEDLAWFAEFLALDAALIAAAAAASPRPVAASTRALKAWIATLAPREKDALLVALATSAEGARADLLRRFGETRTPPSAATRPGRTAAMLRDAAVASLVRRNRRQTPD